MSEPSSPAGSSSGTKDEDQSFTGWVDKYKQGTGVTALADEYQAIKEDKSQNGPMTFCAQNPTLNRYVNVQLFDDTRVVLNDGLQPTYIHASYVNGYKRRKAYIITQAPLPDTIVDYWRTVWQEKVKVIACLTSMKERGSVKAENFFPPSTKRPFRAGPFRIFASSIRPLSGFNRTVIAHLKLVCWYGRRGLECRDVLFIHYGEWPDTAVPQNHKHFLKFVKFVRQLEIWTRDRQPLLESGEPAPLLVNCSAGIGRSATLLACLLCLEQLEDVGQVNVRDLVKSLRRQRCGAVQNALQYVFVHLLTSEIYRQLRQAASSDNSTSNSSGKNNPPPRP